MKTLFVAYRVTDLEHSLDFYTTLGYVELGRVTFDDGGSLALLKFPHDPVATLELVPRPDLGSLDVGGFDHLAIQVDDLRTTLELLRGAASSLVPSSSRPEPKGHRRPGSPTPTGIGSSWCSGHRVIRTASPQRTSPTASRTDISPMRGIHSLAANPGQPPVVTSRVLAPRGSL